MAIKLIAIDMDGTLLLPDHTISPAVKTAIAAARARGVPVVQQQDVARRQFVGEAGEHCVGSGMQRPVLRRGVQGGQRAGRDAGAARGIRSTRRAPVSADAD